MTSGQPEPVPGTTQGPAAPRSRPGLLSSSVAALRGAFGSAIERHFMSSGQTVVYLARDRSHEILAWLKDTP
ncbi:MAG: hypothetical protein ACJ8CN_08755, partial [Gemmatimonadales bacterium]